MRSIQFNTISIKNFLSIGNDPIDITFTPGLHLITGVNKDKDGRRNGVGKSTIMDAIHWGLFGTPLRDINKATIANFNSKGQCVVTIEFIGNINGKSSVYKIVRILNPSKCIIYIDGVDSTLSTVAKTNEFIESVLGFTSPLFKNSVILSINNSQAFLAQDKITKRKFIEGVFNLEVFSDILIDVRQKSIEEKKRIDILQTKIDSKKQNIEVYIGQRDVFSKQTQDKIVDIDNQIKKYVSQLNDTKGKLVDITSISEKLKILKDKRLELISSISSLDDQKTSKLSDIQILKSRVSTIQKDKELYLANFISNTKAEILALQNEKSRIITNFENDIKIKKLNIERVRDDAIKAFRSSNNTEMVLIEREMSDYIKSTQATICPTCKRPLTDKIEIDQVKIDKWNSKLSTLKNAELPANILEKFTNDMLVVDSMVIDPSIISDIDNKISNLKLIEPDKTKITEFDNEVKNIESQIKVALQNINDLQVKRDSLQYEGLQKIDSALENIQNVINNNSKLSVEIEFCNRQIEQLTNQLKNIQDTVNPFISMLDVASKDMDSLNIEMDGCQKMYNIYETAKYIVSEEGVKTYIIKKLLSVLNDRIDYYLRKLDSNSTCVFNEYFEETIKNDKGVDCSYFNFSGAEMKTIDLACLFAFMDLRRMQGDVSINISMYDELFDSSFDEKGLDHVTDILKERVVNNNEAVYVISHRKESLKSVTGDIITLEKQNGITKRVI